MLRNQSHVSMSARYKCHYSINQKCNLGDHKPQQRNFQSQPMEESDNYTISEDLTTLPKPEINLANNKPHVDVQACDYMFPNSSEITTLNSGEALRAPSPTFHAVHSEQYAEKQQEIRQANTNKITGSTPKSRDQEVQFSSKRIKSFPCHLFSVV